MDTAFEYISAGIILSMILGVTGVITTNMVSDRMNQIQQTSSFKVADKMIDAILLSPGTPSNWGRALDSPDGFGLALENGVAPYQLDRTKVSRLSNESVGYIPPHEVRNLIGLSPNYLIRVEVAPMYSITIDEVTNVKFTITVENRWGVPVSAVNVTGAFINAVNVNATEITGLMNSDLDDAVIKTALTDVSGRCTLDFTGTAARPTLMVLANQLNVKSVAVWPDGSVDLVGSIDASMGDSTDFSVETASRNVEIDGMNYYCRLTIWS